MQPDRGDKVGLTVAGCRARQQALRRVLADLRLDAALFSDRRHVHWLTGYWCQAAFAVAAILEQGGRATLVAPLPPEDEVAADDVVVFVSNRLGTLVDDQPGVAWRTVADRIGSFRRIGVDGLVHPSLTQAAPCIDLQSALYAIRRCKAADEVQLIRRAIVATEAAYGFAFDNLAAGTTETDLCAGMLGAATAGAGEIVGEFGNDFQIGSVGSKPRRRAAQAGEVAILDLAVTLRGYRSDMCRSFVVGRQPTDAQLGARARIVEVLEHAERTIGPGLSCRQLDHEARSMLDGFRGWSFPHHLGHGIGLSPHEAPRLNPHWDDVFQVGDVFAVEPGLYGPELRAGIRVEHVYHLSESGLVRLSSFPTELA